MISFETFRTEEGTPLYLQIILFIKRGVVSGQIGEEEELPSRRVLSAVLGVNPNTVQKAYRLLEEEGLIQSHSGAKSYMCINGEKREAIKKQLMERDLKHMVRGLKQMDIAEEEVISMIRRYWEEDEV